MASYAFRLRSSSYGGWLTHPTGYREHAKPICLDGQISDLPVQPPLQKYFRLRLSQITSYPIPSRPNEGRLAIVTNAGRDAVDAAAPARMR